MCWKVNGCVRVRCRIVGDESSYDLTPNTYEIDAADLILAQFQLTSTIHRVMRLTEYFATSYIVKINNYKYTVLHRLLSWTKIVNSPIEESPWHPLSAGLLLPEMELHLKDPS